MIQSLFNSNADGEISVISATKVTITTTSLNTSANTTLAGETANVTANLFIEGQTPKLVQQIQQLMLRKQQLLELI